MPGPIAIFLGSPSDREFVQPALELLDRAQVGYELFVLSAHRNLRELLTLAPTLEARGFRVLIAVAGLSAALPGVLAALTLLPVIGVPRQVGAFQGLDALLSMTQTPKGVPVGVVGVGSMGPINAVLLALRILGLQDERYRKVVQDYEDHLRRKSQVPR